MAIGDIALLLGIPVTHGEFLEQASRSDYLSKYDNPTLDPSDRLELHEESWRRTYSELVAAPLAELAGRASGLGVDVRCRATLETLRKASAEHDTVIVLSHWKGPELSNDDLVEPVDEFVFRQIADGGETALANWLSKSFERNRIPCAAGGEKKWRRNLSTMLSLWKQRKTLRQILREAVTVKLPDDDGSEDSVDEIDELPLTRATLRRDALDQLFAGLIRPGNRLEFFDGLHNRNAIDAAISPTFKGVLDLTTCTSTPLADFLAACRGCQLRTVQFDTEQEPQWAAEYLSVTLELIVQDFTYLDAREIALRLLRQSIHEVAAERTDP